MLRVLVTLVKQLNNMTISRVVCCSGADTAARVVITSADTCHRSGGSLKTRPSVFC